MKYRFLILALIAISFTGCYTSFSPRDYEEEAYGKMDNYYYDSSDVALNADTSEFYYPEEEFYYDDPVQEVTIINNYGTDWGWGGYSPYYSHIYTSYGCYDPFYDPFYDPYCYPYYRPYYAYGYGSFYVGYSSGSGYYDYPSSVRYRTNRSHWTSLRNNGGRSVATRSRDANRGGSLNKEIHTRDEFRKIEGFDLDRDLQVTKIASSSRSSNKGGIRTAAITRDSYSRKKVKRTTDLERRRIPNKSKNNEVVIDSKKINHKGTQRVSKKTRVVNNNKSASKRSKRVYSSMKVSKNNNPSRTSSRAYYNSPSGSSKSSNVSSSSRSRNSNSNGYTSSNNSSRSSSSRSSVSRSSGSSSSRSSVSRSSGSSSSRSSGSRSSSSSRSSSGSSSRRR